MRNPPCPLTAIFFWLIKFLYAHSVGGHQLGKTVKVNCSCKSHTQAAMVFNGLNLFNPLQTVNS